MNFQNSATVLPSAELQFGDMVSSENAQSGPAFQPQEQATGYTATSPKSSDKNPFEKLSVVKEFSFKPGGECHHYLKP